MIREVVKISLNETTPQIFVEGSLVIPDSPIGLVIFAHGSGSNKKSPRNLLMAQKLNENGIGTLLFDLLTKEEQESDIMLENIMSKVPGCKFNKFNITLLTSRLSIATKWIINFCEDSKLKLAFFASSTGAAAALNCATKFDINSIIIRSGRSDLLNTDLSQVVASCLFIVGDKENAVIKINKKTIKQLRRSVDKKLTVVSNASHIFEEQGVMGTATNLVTEWLIEHFRPGA